MPPITDIVPDSMPPLAHAPSQTLGLQLTSATRASFLIQATVMLTPLLSTLAGYRPGPRVWAACGLALAGTLLGCSSVR